MSIKQTPHCVISIAGTDPSGGAGIHADIKAISATGSYAGTIITALVAQNTQGVQAIQEIPSEFVTQQFASVFSDLNVRAVKIGMLHNEAIIEAVAAGIEQYKPKHVVFDPVMVAKNGCALIAPDTIDFLKSRLLPLCTVITPNLPEAQVLLGHDIASTNSMELAAISIGESFKVNVLIKGGHLMSNQASDVLYLYESNEHFWMHAERINTQNTHGTGCTLSAAIASFLAQNHSLHEAIVQAKDYLTQAIRSGSHFQIGHGHGPVDHFYFLGH